MPVTQNAPAPYASSRVILTLVERHRARGLPNPVTTDVLARSGVTDSILTRTMQALQALDLISDDGSHTSTFEGLRLAPEAEYKNALADWVRSAYADAFSFIDPGSATDTEIRDAFRAYKPVPQQDRMVSLFIGLCEAAGLVGEPRKRPAPKTRQAPLQPREKRPTVTGRSDTEQQKPPQFSAPGALPPALAGLIASLPQNGGTWSKGERDRFVHTFSAVLDFCFPVTSGKQARATEDLDE